MKNSNKVSEPNFQNLIISNQETIIQIANNLSDDYVMTINHEGHVGIANKEGSTCGGHIRIGRPKTEEEVSKMANSFIPKTEGDVAEMVAAFTEKWNEFQQIVKNHEKE